MSRKGVILLLTMLTILIVGYSTLSYIFVPESDIPAEASTSSQQTESAVSTPEVDTVSTFSIFMWLTIAVFTAIGVRRLYLQSTGATWIEGVAAAALLIPLGITMLFGETAFNTLLNKGVWGTVTSLDVNTSEIRATIETLTFKQMAWIGFSIFVAVGIWKLLRPTGHGAWIGGLAAIVLIAPILVYGLLGEEKFAQFPSKGLVQITKEELGISGRAPETPAIAPVLGKSFIIPANGTIEIPREPGCFFDTRSKEQKAANGITRQKEEDSDTVIRYTSTNSSDLEEKIWFFDYGDSCEEGYAALEAVYAFR